MFNKLLAVVLMLLFMSNTHAFLDDPRRPFDATQNLHQEMRIKWIVTANLQDTCEQESRRRGFNGFNHPVTGCSFWRGKDCVIVTNQMPTMHTLGHEIRHCFQGNWH